MGCINILQENNHSDYRSNIYYSDTLSYLLVVFQHTVFRVQKKYISVVPQNIKLLGKTFHHILFYSVVEILPQWSYRQSSGVLVVTKVWNVQRLSMKLMI